MIAIIREYAGRNPLRWLIVVPVILLAILSVSWRPLMTCLGFAFLLVLLLAAAFGIVFGPALMIGG